MVLAITTCRGRPGGVLLAPESRSDRVVFLVPQATVMYGLSVVTCRGGRPVWVIGSGGANTPAPARVVYGDVPRGYAEQTAAQPLRPGCYRVTVSGPAWAEFVVNADGSVSAKSGAVDAAAER